MAFCMLLSKYLPGGTKRNNGTTVLLHFVSCIYEVSVLSKNINSKMQVFRFYQNIFFRVMVILTMSNKLQVNK
jgi:hypothetical protein